MRESRSWVALFWALLCAPTLGCSNIVSLGVTVVGVDGRLRECTATGAGCVDRGDAWREHPAGSGIDVMDLGGRTVPGSQRALKISVERRFRLLGSTNDVALSLRAEARDGAESIGVNDVALVHGTCDGAMPGEPIRVTWVAQGDSIGAVVSTQRAQDTFGLCTGAWDDRLRVWLGPSSRFHGTRVSIPDTVQIGNTPAGTFVWWDENSKVHIAVKRTEPEDNDYHHADAMPGRSGEGERESRGCIIGRQLLEQQLAAGSRHGRNHAAYIYSAERCGPAGKDSIIAWSMSPLCDPTADELPECRNPVRAESVGVAVVGEDTVHGVAESYRVPRRNDSAPCGIAVGARLFRKAATKWSVEWLDRGQPGEDGTCSGEWHRRTDEPVPLEPVRE